MVTTSTGSKPRQQRGTKLMSTEAKKIEATKAEKFVEIANRRTGKVIEAIGTLEGLANPTNYEYTTDQWNKIFSAVMDSLNKVKSKVENPGAKASSGFSL